MMIKGLTYLSLAAACLGHAMAWTSQDMSRARMSSLSAQQGSIEESGSSSSRRSMIFNALGVAAAAVTIGSEAAMAEEVEWTPFNGLIFNYRGSSYGGLDADDLDEPSIPYKEFCERLKKGQVEFVEFLAPDGDVAYATFKSSEDGIKPAPIRIGEGYPIEQHDGWSSPAFVVRTIKRAGVPYKFTVPALAKYSSQQKQMLAPNK